MVNKWKSSYIKVIKRDYYYDIDKQFRPFYYDFVGFNPNDFSLNLFSEKEQIETYSRCLAFWTMEYDKLSDDVDSYSIYLSPKFLDPKITAKYFYICKYRTDVLKEIRENSSTDIQNKIFERTNQLLNNNEDYKTK